MLRTESVNENYLGGNGQKVLCVGAASIQFELALRLRIAYQLANRQRHELPYRALRLRGNLRNLLVLRLGNGGPYPYGLHVILFYRL